MRRSRRCTSWGWSFADSAICCTWPYRGSLVFAWYLWLVGRREERRQIGMELLATGVLALTAPAGYWVGVGRPDVLGVAACGR